MCDTLCLRTDAGMVFAKNSDRPPGEPQVLIAHRARKPAPALDTQYLRIDDPGAWALVGAHPTWLWGLEHGVNEHGVAIGNERIWTIDDPKAQPDALIGMDLVRLGLERGDSAKGALEAITAALAEHGQGGSGEHGYYAPYFSSFLIADAHDGWVLETSARSWAARPVGDGASISNRITLSTDWTRASPDIEIGADFDTWRSPTIRTSIADQRLASTRACIARQTLASPRETIADVVATLRDHGNGPWGAPGVPVDAAEEADANPIPSERHDDDRHVTVCMHLRNDQATTGSFVVELRENTPARAWACLGSPCVGVYVPFVPPHVPQILTDPAQWQRFTQLRDRVEADPQALPAVRAVLAPLEHDLWGEADARAEAGTRHPHDFANSRVDRALRSLGV